MLVILRKTTLTSNMWKEPLLSFDYNCVTLNCLTFDLLYPPLTGQVQHCVRHYTRGRTAEDH